MKLLKNFWFAIVGPLGFAGLYTIKDGIGILIGILTVFILLIKFLIVLRIYRKGKEEKNESISPFD